MAARPWDADDDQRLRDLHATGVALGECARQMSRAKSTISTHAERLGLTWSRAQVAAATAARVVDNRARRAALETNLLHDAERLREQLWTPAKVFNFGGKDNTYEERTVDKPPFADQLKIMQAAGVAIDRALRLADHDSSAGADDAKSLLANLGRALGVHDGADA